MTLMEILLPEPEAREQSPRCVVRLRTSQWRDERGLHMRQDLTYLKRECGGDNILDRDSRDIGLGEVLDNIVNLPGLADGLYSVGVCNASTDWETGYVEDYQYRLTPYKKGTT